MTPEQLKEVLRLHALWLSGDVGGKRADLSGANLGGADLTGVILSGANLACAGLSDTKLCVADLSKANLIGATLRGADMRDADLRGADMRAVDMTAADVRYARFCETIISGNVKVNTPPIHILWGDYPAFIWPDVIKIGCQTHTVDFWREATPSRIEELGGDPAEWERWKPVVLGIADVMKCGRPQ